MYQFSRALGDAVKRARSTLGLTQSQVADEAGTNSRTVLNIENYKGNPKMKVLYPLIRFLKIDAREIFNPELQQENPTIEQLRLLVSDCSEQEAATLIPVVQSVLSALRSQKSTEIE